MTSIGRSARVVTRTFARRLSDARDAVRNNEIRNNTIERKFEVLLNEYTASISYVELRNGYELVDSYIPKGYHGQGLGALMAEKIFNHIIDQDKKFKLSCSFLERFYRENYHKYRDHVITDHEEDEDEY